MDESQDLNGVQEEILTRICGAVEDGGRLFMVGDVKQSIYRFRQADPSLFLARYRRAEPFGAGLAAAQAERRIDLQANFRSRAAVVDGVNFIFRQIMTPAAGEMAYDAAAELVFRAPYGPGGMEAPIEFHLLERDKDLLRAAAEVGQPAMSEVAAAVEAPVGEAIAEAEEAEGGAAEEEADDTIEDLNALEREAVVAAQRIRELVIAGEARVWDKATSSYRPARYGDVAVLLRATRHKANAVLDVFARYGIPAYAELGTGYFSALEVDTMLSLLRVLDNPRQDIPLAAVLRSPIGGFSATALAQVRAAHKEGDFFDAVCAAAGRDDLGALGRRLRDFLARVEDWRTRARRGPLSELVWQLLQETGYFDYAGAMPGGRQRQANLRALYERARQFDNFARHGLSRFLRFIERLQNAAGDLGTAPAAGESDDVVRVMSVHKSKGLEFPIVFVLDLGRKFEGRAGHRHLVFQRDLGLGAGVVDPDRRIAWPSLVHAAVRERRRREELAEEMRVLYVALTRARERLILIGSAVDVARTCRDWAAAADYRGWPLPDSDLLAAANWLDWIGPALCRHRDGAPLRTIADRGVTPADETVAQDSSRWDVRVWDAPRVVALTAADASESRDCLVDWRAVSRLEPLDGVDDGPARALLAERISWRYPWHPLAGLPAKQSVSELKRRWDRADAEEREEGVPRVRLPVRLARRPRFLQAAGRPLTAAERGTVVHLVLQHLDLRRPLDENGLLVQVQAMAARGLLTAEQVSAVDTGQLARFFASTLGQRLQRHADHVRREIPFTLALSAAEVYPHLDPVAAADERVVVQGVIDCLIVFPGELVLLDFKTDAIAPDALGKAAQLYDGQIALYRRAVEEIYGRPVTEAYLVFLAAGEAVRM
ncbi:MAG: hypothetical protein BAA04_12140 [Firmicutes bacterium ZCTH02-B6]|nr:MAG: hypothetical protein BAA04_12140 [Firmicutes bacterium ZCTH02-B6]